MKAFSVFSLLGRLFLKAAHVFIINIYEMLRHAKISFSIRGLSFFYKKKRRLPN